jgi:hypothetical protein
MPLSLANALAHASEYWTFAARRTLEACANFSEADAQLGHGSAEGIPVNPQLFCGFALIPFVGRKDLSQILSFEFFHSILVANAGGMHLSNQAVQVSSHVNLLLY